LKTKDKYEWVIGRSLPVIDPHTQVKHQLVYDYVHEYVGVLMSNANIPRLTLTLVDGFAGGGLYSAPEGTAPGSPLLLLHAVEDAEALLNVGRDQPRGVDAQYHFVEVEPNSHEHLRHVLNAEGYASRLNQDIKLYNSRFEAVCADVVSRIKSRRGGERAIFVLDQYAYDDVPMSILRSIFDGLAGAEVILTFNVDSLIAFLSDKPKCRAKMREIGLEPYIDWAQYDVLKEGSRWRPIIQQQLANGILSASGAKFLTLFFVTPLGSTPWSYWLVHLSRKYRARDVMMNVHWDHGNSFGHSLEPGIFNIGYEARRDEAATGQASMFLGEAHAFDSVLRGRCVATLGEELPRVIHEHRDGIAFSDLLMGLANRTTATADLMRESLDISVRSGEILVKSAKGIARRKGASIHETDILIPSPQQRIFS
jgi:three-Cys-motif partner protein